jgi:hypothetical protein
MTAEADVGRRLEWRTGEAALDEGSGAEWELLITHELYVEGRNAGIE